jgi:hypothetical protein
MRLDCRVGIGQRRGEIERQGPRRRETIRERFV